jgi:hypothetical protein
METGNANAVSTTVTSPDVKATFKIARMIIKAISIILLFFFAYLEFGNIPIDSIITKLDFELIYQIGIALYFLSWIFGTTFDLNTQEEVYVTKMKPKYQNIRMIIGFSVLGIFFAFICAFLNSNYFSLFVLLFWIINYVSLIYLHKVESTSYLSISKKYYQEQKNKVRLYQVEKIDNYLNYNGWQKNRFYIGLVLLILLNVFVFTNAYDFISDKIWNISKELFVSLWFLVCVLFIEAWVWYKRIYLKSAIMTIKDLEEGLLV